MSDPQPILSQRFAEAIVKAFGPEHAEVDPLVRPAQNPKFGDYQANVAMSLAKRVGANPRDVAAKIIDVVDLSGLCEPPDIAGPGFINLKLTGEYVAQIAGELAADDRLGIEAQTPARVVVDYSSPNVAKEMHVGHLRSTVIGDCLVRILESLGHQVIRQNHVGDWGTQFGMLIENLIDAGEADAADQMSPAQLTEYYQQSKVRFDEDADFNARARQRVVALQGDHEATRDVWRKLVGVSVHYFQSVYERLGVKLEAEDIKGESAYNDRLEGVVKRLADEGHLKQSQGAQVVYPEGFGDQDGQPLPMIVRKSDGGFLYATTDLAAAMYRVNDLGATRIVYVIGLPQKQHFEMFSTALRQFGWIGDDIAMDYVGFGSILGEDRKMFRTRSGETVKLIDLLDEAQRRAGALVREKNPEIDGAQQTQVADVVGIGAIKYADLSSDRTKDYVFSWNRMLAMEGNTSPYLQYAYARIRSIFRKANVAPASLAGVAIEPIEPAERALVLKLVQFGSTVGRVGQTLEPHHLCNYLYDLATAFSGFYENCPVLKADQDATRESRLRLCDLTADVLAHGLGLLGIKVLDRM